jgi:hypothetical protein
VQHTHLASETPSIVEFVRPSGPLSKLQTELCNGHMWIGMGVDMDDVHVLDVGCTGRVGRGQVVNQRTRTGRELGRIGMICCTRPIRIS